MRGRVLRVKLGFNPNSSSIGTNLTPLLLGGFVALIAAPVVSFLVARRLRKGRAVAKLENPQRQDADATVGHSGSGSSIDPDRK